MKYSKEELLLIWLDSFIGLDRKLKLDLYESAVVSDGIKNMVSKSRDYIISASNKNVYENLIASANDGYLKFLLDGYNRKGIVAVTIESSAYPETLRNISIPPLVLYAKGDVGLLKSKCFSVVGSRKSLPSSINVAENYASALCASGFTLVTGIAEGVDTAVITKTLELKGKVISVLAGGHSNVYPASNIALANKVEESGLTISEYPPEVKAMPYFFPIRNRIIAGLSLGTLVVSGGVKSGTIHTARYAEEFGKDLFVIPYGVGVASGAGCNELIKMGGMLTDTPDDILEFYGEQKKEKISLSAEEKEICTLLLDGERHIEYICANLGKKIYEVSPIISILEIKGVISKNGSNVYGLLQTDLED